MNLYLERASEEIHAATGHLTVEGMARRIPGKWSIAEILEHLTLTFALNVRSLEKALAAGETKSARPTAFKWLSRIIVIDLGYFPPARAPELVTPRGSIEPERSRAAIHDALVTLDTTLDRAAARFGSQTPLLKHAFFAGLTVPQWRKFHWRHTRHHMGQVRKRSAAPTQ